MINIVLQQFGGRGSSSGGGRGGGKGSSAGGSSNQSASQPQNAARSEEEIKRSISLAHPDAASKIVNGETYTIVKVNSSRTLANYGQVQAEDARAILKGYKYDELYGLWFSKSGAIAYEVKRVRR